MRVQNGRLAALVAAVAVAAVTGGGALAYRQGPQANAEGSVAAPLSTAASAQTPSSGTPKPTAARSEATSTPKPTAPPSQTTATPTSLPTTRIDLKTLAQGREPQVAYLYGRKVLGGAGSDITIPGTMDIQQVARLGITSLAVVTKGSGNELLTFDDNGKIIRHTPDVTQIFATDDGTAAAYLGTKLKSTGEPTGGATVYAEDAKTQNVQQVQIPGVWNTMLRGYTNGTVYFDASTTRNGTTTLYQWTPGDSKATPLKAIPSAMAVSSVDTAGSITTQANQNSCSNLLTVPAGKRLWRTCDYIIAGFTPDAATVIAGPMYEDGYGQGIAAALNAKNGSLIHEWSGVFRQAVPEDDQHLLLLADDGAGTPAAIVRCTITTGTCELATPLTKAGLQIGA
ncbi:hypothetical protein JOF29_005575 [Kribbella aluminosa]|uniref:Uncharacterized protein n=1 Tax=Kribbella aluminosa TaxID=416017 RepID=A0ABS4US54_9ACTN|nr:hypothetical protein [Kribbella aluminosa]MBP2354465.1 hypothetical protein [Kribbella aluminosa]